MSDNYEPHAVPASAIQSSQPKSTITKKGNTRAKKGLGARKTGGLGAQKVKKIDFSELEKNAEEADKATMRLSVSSSGSDKKPEKLDESSRRLAYQDIEKRELQNDKKLSAMDGRKKEQASRLGMGMGKVEGVSHSMKIMTIDQQTPQDDRLRRFMFRDDDLFFDAKSTMWMNDNSEDEDEKEKLQGRRDFSYKQSFSKGDSKPKSFRNEPPTYTIEPIEDTHKSISSVIISNSASDFNESSRQRKTQQPHSNAKSISSDQVYGDQDKEEYERQQRMRNFAGRTAISSDDYQGRTSNSASYGRTMPDLGPLKEGVRSVAGRMSSAMSGLASTIQDRYGT